MPQSIEEIVSAVLELSETDRHEVLDRIEASMKPPSSSLHPDWKAEIQRRSAELDSGLVKGIPWEEVCRQADERYGAEPQHG